MADGHCLVETLRSVEGPRWAGKFQPNCEGGLLSRVCGEEKEPVGCVVVDVV